MGKQVFNYNGIDISFKKGNSLMIKATEMAKSFNKSPKDYIKNQSTQDLIKTLCARLNCLPDDLVEVIDENGESETWMHEEIALDFAQWLNIDFNLLCNNIKNAYLTNQIAQELSMSTKSLNELLKTLGVQYEKQGTWLLKSKYQNLDLTKTKTFAYKDEMGETRTSMSTVWTEKGRLFIHNLIKQQNESK